LNGQTILLTHSNHCTWFDSYLENIRRTRVHKQVRRTKTIPDWCYKRKPSFP